MVKLNRTAGEVAGHGRGNHHGVALLGNTDRLDAILNVGTGGVQPGLNSGSPAVRFSLIQNTGILGKAIAKVGVVRPVADAEMSPPSSGNPASD